MFQYWCQYQTFATPIFGPLARLPPPPWGIRSSCRTRRRPQSADNLPAGDQQWRPAAGPWVARGDTSEIYGDTNKIPGNKRTDRTMGGGHSTLGSMSFADWQGFKGQTCCLWVALGTVEARQAPMKVQVICQHTPSNAIAKQVKCTRGSCYPSCAKRAITNCILESGFNQWLVQQGPVGNVLGNWLSQESSRETPKSCGLSEFSF